MPNPCFWTKYVNVQEDCEPVTTVYSLVYESVKGTFFGSFQPLEFCYSGAEDDAGFYTCDGDGLLTPATYVGTLRALGAGNFIPLGNAVIHLSLQGDLPLGQLVTWTIHIVRVNPMATPPPTSSVDIALSPDTTEAVITFFNTGQDWGDVLTHQDDSGDGNCNSRAYIEVEFRAAVSGNVVATTQLQIQSHVACF